MHKLKRLKISLERIDTLCVRHILLDPEYGLPAAKSTRYRGWIVTPLMKNGL